jgi:hypothetical protein
MSDVEYEYVESDDDDSPEYIYQHVWQSVSKRMHWRYPRGIILHVLEDDDMSVLTVLFDVVSKGIHCEKLAHLRSIEALENAIVNRPHKKHGYGRIAEIRRLTDLILRSKHKNLYTSSILELHIENQPELNGHVLWGIEMQCPCLERIVFKKSIPTTIRKYFKQVKHVVLMADSIPSLYGTLLDGAHTLEIHGATHISDVHILKQYIMYQELDVKFVHVVLHEWQAQLLQSHITWAHLQVRVDNATIPYEDWRSQQTKRRRLLLRPETMNPKPFLYEGDILHAM